jgi:photosystem II stability/assembly factor-like uncharacterized protein
MPPGAIRIAALLVLPLLSVKLAAQEAPQLTPPLPQHQAQERHHEYAERLEQYYATHGTARGMGFKQKMRALEFFRSRYYPSGDPVNVTALTWLNHLRYFRSPDVEAARREAAAAGISANWRQVLPELEAPSGQEGRVNALAFHPSDPAIIYAATAGGGLGRTQDGGRSWKILTDAMPLLTVTDLAIDAHNPNTIYIMTGDGEMQVQTSIGVLKTTDGGETWSTTGLVWKIDQRHYGHRLAIHPKEQSLLLAGSSAGLHRTTDGGKTWTHISGPASGQEWNRYPEAVKSRITEAAKNTVWDIVFHPTDPAVVYAASRTDIYRSSDSGQTWSRLTDGLPVAEAMTDSQRIRLAATPASPDTLYVLYGTQWGFTLGLYRSDDRGNSFTKRASTIKPPGFSLGTPNVLHEYNNFHSQADYDLAMAVSPTNVDRVHVGALDIWRSDNGGRTWTQSSSWTARPASARYTHADIHTLIYRGDTLFAGTDGGVFQSNDGGDNWSNISAYKSGFVITQLWGMCISPQDPHLIYYGTQDNGTFRLRTDGRLTSVMGGDGMLCQIDPKNSQTVYASSQFGDIRRSDNGGRSFDREVTPRVDVRPIRAPWVTPYVLGPENSNHIYLCAADVWFSPNRGFEWNNLSNGALGPSIRCNQVAIAPSDPKTIYVVKEAERQAWQGRTSEGGDPRPPFFGGGGVFRTTDGGATWQLISGKLPLADAAPTDIAVSPIDARRAWVTFSGYKADSKVFATTDGGMTWNNISEGLPNLPVKTVAAQDVANNAVYIGLDVGAYYRDDRIGRWVPFMDGMPNMIVQQLVIDKPRNRIFAATFARGIYVTDLATPCYENCPKQPPRQFLPSGGSPQPSVPYAGPIDIFE